MFELLKDKAVKVHALDVNSLAGEVWRGEDSQEIIINLNQRQLYDRGEDSKGASLGEYAEMTKLIKREMSLPFDRVTLFHDGDFYKSFKVTVLDDGFDITADGQKPDKNLFDVYGEDITGLSDASLTELAGKILTTFTNYARQAIL